MTATTTSGELLTASPGTGRRRERVNLRWVVGSWVVGGLSIAAAFVMEHFYSWQGVSLETMVNIGTALLLAGVLFFLQRRFVTDVEEVVSRAAISAADERIDEHVGQVGARIDELEERMNEVLTARRQRQDEAIGSLDVPTFESVATALAEANTLGALAYDHVTVQASTEITELGLEFSWGVDLGDGRFGRRRRAVLMVSGHVYADERAGGSRPVIETTWEPGDPAEEVGLRLREQLENRGRWHGNGTLNWPMALRNLKRSLDLAVRSRRRDGTGLVLEGPSSSLWERSGRSPMRALNALPKGSFSANRSSQSILGHYSVAFRDRAWRTNGLHPAPTGSTQASGRSWYGGGVFTSLYEGTQCSLLLGSR